MSDFEFLCWLHERLSIVHGESPLLDYMHRLRAIIASTPKDRHSEDSASNNLEEMKRFIENPMGRVAGNYAMGKGF